MTKEETIRILERVCRLYVTQARKLSAEQKVAMVETWADEFRNDSYTTIDNAISSYMRQGKPFMPEVADVINILNAGPKTTSSAPAESVKLFNQMERVADIIVNRKTHTSIVDPGGYRWNEDLNRNVYYHPDLVVTDKLYTQYDFAQLPMEIREHVEDIDGLRFLWREIQSNRDMAYERFETRLPQIKAELKKRREQTRKENQAKLEAIYQKMNSNTKLKEVLS